jgi:16S rRNA processing protein RimM
MISVCVKKYRSHQGFDLLTLEGMEDINVVESFRGCLVYADDEPIEKMENNEFQMVKLLNAKILQGGHLCGTVSGTRNYPQGDYLEITKTDGTSGLIPFRDEFILNIDPVSQTIEIVEMEGLL